MSVTEKGPEEKVHPGHHSGLGFDHTGHHPLASVQIKHTLMLRAHGEIGDGLVVVGDVRVQTRFFQCGGDSSELEWGGYKTRGQ